MSVQNFIAIHLIVVEVFQSGPPLVSRQLPRQHMTHIDTTVSPFFLLIAKVTPSCIFKLLHRKSSSTHLVEVAEFPEEDQQLLVELDLLGGMRQVGLDQRIVKQPCQTFQDEA